MTKMIFLSHPTILDDKYKLGLENFISFLEKQDLKVLTLGINFYGSDNPLDEILWIFDCCDGAIILGYPKIYIEKGTIKNKLVEKINLSSEWNHIETCLAKSKNINTLVIKDEKIKDNGIFELGSTGIYIHSTNLENDNWFENYQIIGAVKSLISDLPNDFLKLEDLDYKILEALNKNNESLNKIIAFINYHNTYSNENIEERFSSLVTLGYIMNISTITPEDINSLKENIKQKICTLGEINFISNIYKITSKGTKLFNKNLILRNNNSKM